MTYVICLNKESTFQIMLSKYYLYENEISDTK